jgi:hypothetical protein
MVSYRGEEIRGRSSIKKNLLFALGTYALCVILVAGLWLKPILLILCYVLMSLILFAKCHTGSDCLFYAVAFVLGSLAEFVAVYFGAWEYSKPFYFIPIWLPFAWGMGALFMKNISETLLRIIRK